MIRSLLILLLIPFLLLPVNAMEFIAPEVPESGKEWMPYQTESFAQGIGSILKDAAKTLHPQLSSASKTTAALIVLCVLVSSVKLLPGCQERITELIGVVSVSTILLGNSTSLIHLAVQTVETLSEYGKLLMPVLTSALAAQGGITASGALYAGTLIFDTILSSLLRAIIVPLLYILCCLAMLFAASGQELIGKLRDLVKWLITWSLKIALYVFTGYMGITGVVSGTTDAATLKATKLAISGMVPIVGSILSDSSEAVLVGAGVMKNAVGIYGLLAILAVWIGPFFKIGIQYLLLKVCFGVCGIFPTKQTSTLIKDFSGIMGILLAMTGAECLFLLISIVCFMKGVS